MLIECLIERDGPTEIVINKFKYMFEKNDKGHYVCEVFSEEHRKWLLRETRSFKVYEPQKKKKPKQPKTPQSKVKQDDGSATDRGNREAIAEPTG